MGGCQTEIHFYLRLRPAGQEVLGSDDDINGANDDTVRPSTPGPIQEDVMMVLLNCLPS